MDFVHMLIKIKKKKTDICEVCCSGDITGLSPRVCVEERLPSVRSDGSETVHLKMEGKTVRVFKVAASRNRERSNL